MNSSARKLSVLLLVLLLAGACQPIQAPTPVAPSAPTATALPTAGAAPTATFAPIPDAKMEVITERISSPALAGNLLGDPAERTVNVLLPPSYANSDARYPVVYVMPWFAGAPDDDTGRFASIMGTLLRKGEIREMIVVIPDGTDSLGGSNFRSSAIIGDYETYLTQDVVNYIDAHYRTLATRASRGLTGCLNGGSAAMRLGLLYPGVFSVVAPTDGVYDESLEVWPSDVESLHQLTELPQDISHLELAGLTGWYVQRAAAYAPAPDNPPFYCEAPFRIVDGHGEFVPEVIAKIVEHDAAHEARRYMQQPVRLRGILIQQASREEADYVGSTRDFEKLLTELSIEHEYMEPAGSHCIHPWKPVALKYMTEHLVFQNP